MLKHIIQSIYFLIVNPQKGWKRVAAKRFTHQIFINDYLFPIFGFIALTTFVGAMWVEESGNLQHALKQVMIVVSALFGGFYLASYLTELLYLKYEQMKDSELIQQFVGYGSTVVYLLFFVMPLLSGFEILWLFILYTLFVVYSGVNEFLKISEKTRTIFTMGSFVVITFVPVLLYYILSRIIV